MYLSANVGCIHRLERHLLLLTYGAISGTRTGGFLVLIPRKLESQGIKS